MGVGHEGFNEDLMAWKSDYRFSEMNGRGFYNHWARMMDAESWADLQATTAGR